MTRVLLLLVIGNLAGCASLSHDLDAVLATQQSIELAETPFFPQERYQCGPAALATVLAANGLAVTPDELSPAVFTPGRRGSLQQDLIGATRLAGMLPYRIDRNLPALLDELAAGRPVLVLQNLGTGWWPRWHYAVVIGYDRDARRILLRSGRDKRRATRVDAFLNTWARSDYWGILALAPGEIPQSVDQARYFKAVAAVESVGASQAALRFWLSAATHWPADPIPLLGQGNAHLALANYADAASAFESLLKNRQFRSVATNNLAYAKARLGRFDEALALLDTELGAPEDPALVPTMRETREEILTMRKSVTAGERS